MKYDLLIKGGTLVDPAEGIHAHKDIGFANNLVSEIGDNLPEQEARNVLDARERLVTPGMIDLQ